MGVLLSPYNFDFRFVDVKGSELMVNTLSTAPHFTSLPSSPFQSHPRSPIINSCFIRTSHLPQQIEYLTKTSLQRIVPLAPSQINKSRISLPPPLHSCNAVIIALPSPTSQTMHSHLYCHPSQLLESSSSLCTFFSHNVNKR